MEMIRLVKKGVKFLFNSKYRFYHRASHGKLNHLSDEQYLKKLFKFNFNRELNLENPKTYNEKLQWLKLYDRRPEYTAMVDKHEVKEYVAKSIGEKYVIKTLGVWESFDEIDFESLPNRFVLKCTHDSGGLAICKDKNFFDFAAAKKKINSSLSKNYYYSCREWPYKNVKPRILAEKYMQDENASSEEPLHVYKIMTFNGVPKIIQTIQRAMN